MSEVHSPPACPLLGSQQASRSFSVRREGWHLNTARLLPEAGYHHCSYSGDCYYRYLRQPAVLQSHFATGCSLILHVTGLQKIK